MRFSSTLDHFVIYKIFLLTSNATTYCGKQTSVNAAEALYQVDIGKE